MPLRSYAKQTAVDTPHSSGLSLTETLQLPCGLESWLRQHLYLIPRSYLLDTRMCMLQSFCVALRSLGACPSARPHNAANDEVMQLDRQGQLPVEP